MTSKKSQQKPDRDAQADAVFTAIFEREILFVIQNLKRREVVS